MNERPQGSGLLTGIRDGRVDQLIQDYLATSPKVRASSSLLYDPLRASARDLTHKQVNSQFTVGLVIQALPYLNWYRLQLSDNGGIVAGAKLNHHSRNPIGGRDIGVIQPLSRVLVYKPLFSQVVYILGVLPPDIADDFIYRSGFIWPGGQSGLYREGVHNALLRPDDGGEARNFSAGAPLDETTLDYGKVFETGLMFQMDPFMAQLRVNEFTGLMMSYYDSYLRLGGLNFDLATAVQDLRARLDQGELRSVTGKSVYWWESLGRPAPGSGVGELQDEETVLRTAPLSLWDLPNGERDLVPVHRRLEFDGYEGQGGLRLVGVPDETANANLRSSFRSEGVFMESIGLHGSWTVAAASQIALLKRTAIFFPLERKTPEDKQGDTEQNYRFAGQYGSGPVHQVGQPELGETSGVGVLAAIDDLLAYAVQWRAAHPFYYHQNDYELPEPSESSIGPVQETLQLGAAANGAPLAFPTPRLLKIDHRFAQGRFYAREAGLVMTDDASVVHFDGYGNRITMGAKGIRMESPIGIEVVSGGDVIAFSRQLVLRAHESVDITSSNKDLRLFAAKNMQASADNMLLESRSENGGYDYQNRTGEEVSGTGITLKSATTVGLLGDNLYLRSGVGKDERGDIVLDAGNRQNDVVLQAKNVIGFLGSQMQLFTLERGQDPQQIVALGGKQAVIHSELIIGGSTVITGDNPDLIVEGNIFSGANIECAGIMADEPGAVFPIDDRFQSKLKESLTVIEEVIEIVKKKIKPADQAYWDDGWYIDFQLGNEELLAAMGFSFRDDEAGLQYRVSQLRTFEPRWVTMARNGLASGSSPWQETSLQYQGRDLYPWPGRKAWEEQSVLVRPTGSEGLFDYATGNDADRGERYENASLSAPEAVPFRHAVQVTL